MSFQRAVLLTTILIGAALLLTPSVSATVSCCLPTEACEHTATADDCKNIGGEPFQYCCEDGDCPPVGCINATGYCYEPHATPGCDPVGCCAAVCDILPECCTGPWTAECAAQAFCPHTADVMVCCTADGCAYNNTANCVNNLWGQYFQEDCEGNCDALCEAPITPFCGDGNLDPGEECDDGNFLDGDGCASDCTLEQDVPTTTGIGVALMVLLLGGSSAYFLRRK